MKSEENNMKGRRTIFERLMAGESIPMNDPDYGLIRKAVNATRLLTVRLNQATDPEDIRSIMAEITGQNLDPTTTVFTPFFTNYGRNISLGKNVFINHACSFLDLGGITVKDDVMIGPRVSITSENHPVDPVKRKIMVPGHVVIERNVWIGAGATVLPGITIGENAVVGAQALVTRDVPANTVVAGLPAKVIRRI